MAASFPTALQRTSDERWVTLDVVAREQHRALARIVEAPSQAAVVRLQHGLAYDHHLRALLSMPPPDPGRGVHVAWPVDLLHDLDARAIGYAAPRPPGGHTFPLADFVDPTRRAQIAPMATRRHLLRVARNVATATAALHHSGYARIRGRQFRLDDRARVVVVRTDELIADASQIQMADDQRRLGYLVLRLLGGRPWASEGELAGLIRRAGDPAQPAAPAEEWFFALRQAERSLPKTPSVATAPAEPERLIVGTDLATALRKARRDAPPTSPPKPAQPPARPSDTPRGLSPLDVPGGQTRQASERLGPTPATGRPATGTPSRLIRISSATTRETAASAGSPTGGLSPLDVPGGQTRQPSGREGPMDRTATSPGGGLSPLDAPGGRTRQRSAAAAPGSGRRRRRASHVDGRHTVDAIRRHTQTGTDRAGTAHTGTLHTGSAQTGSDRPLTEESATTLTARGVFGVAAGLTVGGLASVAPFAIFLAVVCIMILRAAIRAGLRRSTMGPLQTMAIALTRLVPFATGGLAFAAFILLDLLLVLGLCMALAELLFGYGPGFTLTWILQLPEVPGLVRAFAFAVGAFAGLVLGGQTYDRIRRDAGSRRMIATPAIAMALAMGTLVVDASITWWPLPLLA